MLPNTSEQTISILPRTDDFYLIDDIQQRVSLDGGSLESIECVEDIIALYNEIDVYIRQDGSKLEESITDVYAEQNVNYLDLTFASTILEEGETYFIQVTSSDNQLIYRGKIYATSQTDYTTKHTIANSNYTQYNIDETYTVIE